MELGSGFAFHGRAMGAFREIFKLKTTAIYQERTLFTVTIAYIMSQTKIYSYLLRASDGYA